MTSSSGDTPLSQSEKVSWRAATWMVPVWGPFQLGILFILVWAFGKISALDANEAFLVIVSVVVGTLLTSTAILFLFRRESLIARGVALGMAGATALITVGGLIVGVSSL